MKKYFTIILLATFVIGITSCEKDEDTTPPVITLIGNNPMTWQKDQTFTEPGATAVDNVDGNIPFDQFTVINNVNVNAEGEYTITYKVSDKAGNEAEATRTVNVLTF